MLKIKTKILKVAAKIAVPMVLKSWGWLESFKFNTVKFAILDFCKHKLLTNKNT